jgi:hypothetical protein
MQNLTQPYPLSSLPYLIHPSMHAISWCNVGLAQKFKKCVMHAFITMPTLMHPKPFDPSPTQHIELCSTFPSLWLKHCSSTPLPCPLVFGRRRGRIHANLGNCLRKPCCSLPTRFLPRKASLYPPLTLHRPFYPTRAPPHAPHAPNRLCSPSATTPLYI